MAADSSDQLFVFTDLVHQCVTNTGSQGRLLGDGLWRIIEEPRSKEFLRVISKGRRDGSRNHLEPGVTGTKDAGLVSRTLAPSEDLAFAKGLLLTPHSGSCQHQ